MHLSKSSALVVLLVLFAAGCGSSGDSGTKTTAPTPGQIPQGRKSLIFEAGPVTMASPDAAKVLDQIVALGADTVRVGVFWQYVAPPTAPPAGADPADPADPMYDFSVTDAFIAAARKRGLKVLVTVSGPPPEWATVDGKAGSAPDVSAFGDFVHAVAERYNGSYDPDGGGPLEKLPGADMWSVWNEPNLSIFLTPQIRDGKPYSPILYRKLYLAAQASIEDQDPGTPILIGETAPTGSRDSVDPVPFARGVLCLDPVAKAAPACDSGKIDAAGWALHPYGSTGEAPFDPPDSSDFVTTSSLDNLESVLDDAADAGTITSDFPLYITEYGIQSKPDPLIGVPLQTQADYLSISEQIAYFDPRVKSYAQYLMVDDPPDRVPGEKYGGFESGLEFYGGAAKPSYDSFRLPLVVRRSGDSVSLWGLVRPSRSATEVEIRVQDGGVRKSLESLKTDGDGIFTLDSDYRQGRLWSVRWKSPSGQTFDGPWTRSYKFPYPKSDTGAPSSSG